jgi:hypothetical protein
MEKDAHGHIGSCVSGGAGAAHQHQPSALEEEMDNLAAHVGNARISDSGSNVDYLGPAAGGDGPSGRAAASTGPDMSGLSRVAHKGEDDRKQALGTVLFAARFAKNKQLPCHAVNQQ